MECLSDMPISGSGLYCFQPYRPSEALSLSPQVSAPLSLALSLSLPNGSGVPSFDRTTATSSSRPDPPPTPRLYVENVVSVDFKKK